MDLLSVLLQEEWFGHGLRREAASAQGITETIETFSTLQLLRDTKFERGGRQHSTEARCASFIKQVA